MHANSTICLEKVVCLESMRGNVFSTAAAENIDSNSRVNHNKRFFHRKWRVCFYFEPDEWKWFKEFINISKNAHKHLNNKS